MLQIRLKRFHITGIVFAIIFFQRGQTFRFDLLQYAGVFYHIQQPVQSAVIKFYHLLFLRHRHLHRCLRPPIAD